MEDMQLTNIVCIIPEGIKERKLKITVHALHHESQGPQSIELVTTFF